MSVVWSWVIVAEAPVEPACEAGAVVVVVGDFEGVGVLEDVGVLDDAWLLSSWANLASSALRVDCAEETDSLSAVVSRVPSDSPAVTC